MTELDHTVLAIVGRDGPMSAYDVRKEFSGSLTPAWSSSTGSIYPCIRRLVESGRLTASAPKGGRSKRILAITPAGRRVLRDWLSSDTALIASATPDPIRTRCYFLSLMTRFDRDRFLDDALRSTEKALASAEAIRNDRLKAKLGSLQHLVSEGVIFELAARRDWLRLMIACLARQAPTDEVDTQPLP